MHELPEFYKFLYPTTREAHLYGLAMTICSMGNQSDWTVVEGTRGCNIAIVAINYFTKWVNVEALSRITEKKTTDFI